VTACCSSAVASRQLQMIYLPRAAHRAGMDSVAGLRSSSAQPISDEYPCKCRRLDVMCCAASTSKLSLNSPPLCCTRPVLNMTPGHISLVICRPVLPGPRVYPRSQDPVSVHRLVLSLSCGLRSMYCESPCICFNLFGQHLRDI
jgi:hypothetical protein